MALANFLNEMDAHTMGAGTAMVLLTQASGAGIITNNVYENRLQVAVELNLVSFQEGDSQVTRIERHYRVERLYALLWSK